MSDRPARTDSGLPPRKSPSKRQLALATACFLVPIFATWLIIGRGSGGTGSDIVEQDGEVYCHLGDLAQGAQVVRTVPIRNRTDSPLVIEGVSRSCSCLGADVDRQIIAPGDAANLTVTLLAPDRLGGFQHQVLLAFAGGEPSITVRFLGTVGAWIQEDISVVAFGEACGGEPVRATVRLRASEPWPEDQQQFEFTLPYGKVSNIDRDPDGKTIVCTLVFDPPTDAPKRVYKGDFIVKWIGFEGRILKYPCTAKVVTEWFSEPAEVAVGKISPGQTSEVRFNIGNRKKADPGFYRGFKVVGSPPGSLSVATAATSRGLSVSASIVPNRSDGAGIRSARIEVLSHDGASQLSIPVFWEVGQ